jgi:hypothetical protein
MFFPSFKNNARMPFKGATIGKKLGEKGLTREI